jgi:hypothetical protein
MLRREALEARELAAEAAEAAQPDEAAATLLAQLAALQRAALLHDAEHAARARHLTQRRGQYPPKPAALETGP